MTRHTIVEVEEGNVPESTGQVVLIAAYDEQSQERGHISNRLSWRMRGDWGRGDEMSDLFPETIPQLIEIE